ncbi:hypothetical protein BC792_101223 [Sphingobacterium allocomposti]|jgi:hypothetical protein|uniref:Uncharacterized protein n=1 Tax=Sphingobacterium allocomposti TaxID=415956 RepID=A0A5S5DU84_9SPHI|nr:hypothetical protein [Sphingobacterium composti Yoo et al. 2007 non Ten et al. 2007]TYP98566.1 hypothetical protein BC792_101223 [Sphingobacterium composti Yoo et al. 2007 non Ten et al. 2007]HLS95438.1 hypothetical protein [Sphingobacterium sp.]
MRGILIVNKFWTNLFSARKAAAVTVFPFIFVLNRSFSQDRVLVNHERIHIRQALEMLVIPFYLWYLLEFLIRYVRYGRFRKAYLNICFEREAYAGEKDQHYLKKRKPWAFLLYL